MAYGQYHTRQRTTVKYCYPLLALLVLALAQIACSDNGATDIVNLRTTSQQRAWCGTNSNINDVCVITP